jgi:hypothetical protein
MSWLRPALWRDIIVEKARRGVGVIVEARQEQSYQCLHGLIHMLIGEAVIISSKELRHHVSFH